MKSLYKRMAKTNSQVDYAKKVSHKRNRQKLKVDVKTALAEVDTERYDSEDYEDYYDEEYINKLNQYYAACNIEDFEDEYMSQNKYPYDNEYYDMPYYDIDYSW